jgi:site-specific DNA-methyltransferase (adenine-specific)
METATQTTTVPDKAKPVKHFDRGPFKPGCTYVVDPTSVVPAAKDRVRTDLGDIAELMSSITEHGQIQPAAVHVLDRKLALIAGERRRLAAERLGIGLVVYVMTAREALAALRMQLDENLKRKAFDALEEADGLQRLKALYEKEHPEAKRGAAGPGRPKKAVARKKVEAKLNAKTNGKANGATDPDPAPRFSRVAAAAMGCSETKVNDLLAIARLPAEARRKVSEAKTTAERNKIARELLSQARKARRVEKMTRQAAARSHQRQQMILGESAQGKRAVVIHHGDCLQLMQDQPADMYDLVLTDPPYDRERSSIAHVSRAAINPKAHAWDKLDVGWVIRVAPLLSAGAQILAFCPGEAIGAYEIAFEVAKLDYRMHLIWAKTNPGPAHRPTYVPATEAIVWAVKKGATPFFRDFESQAGGEALSWIQGPICGEEERLHPTQKPRWLIGKLLDRHADAKLEHRVFDPFCGSGTTGVCCRERLLACTMIEQDKGFHAMATARMAALEAA